MTDKSEPELQRREHGSSNPASGLAAWVIVRASGLLLVLLLLAHFAYTHLIHDVAETNAAFVSRHMRSPLFFIWNWSMLVLALAHAAAASWTMIAEYTTRWRAVLRIGMVVSAGLIFVLGASNLIHAALGR